MALLKLMALSFTALIIVQAKVHQHHKRDSNTNICDPAYNNTNGVQCFCVLSPKIPQTLSASCHLARLNFLQNDTTWNAFDSIRDTKKLILSNTNGIILKYIPTTIFQYLEKLTRLDIKYGNIESIESFAFGNSSSVEEIMLTDNQIKTLAVNAFAHHQNLTSINMDTNNIIEINRDVFTDLPSLVKLCLTNNKITTIHDRAFVHLENLRELEIDRNSIFSLNIETFTGLKRLQKLGLSSNALQVIGDNTFLPLQNLRMLNLEKNKIQMLDDKAFNGLSKLSALSLAYNHIRKIENVKVFEGMISLHKLSFKGNHLDELKTNVMAPILSNFYSNTSSLEVEDNSLPCDCRLEWLMTLLNQTQSVHLKLAIENLKCIPDAGLKDRWAKNVEQDKNNGQAGGPVFNEEEAQTDGDYEYYDEPQQNGTLFYTDIRDLINCTKHQVNGDKPKINTKVTSSLTTTTEYLSTKLKDTKAIEMTTNKVMASQNQETYTTARLATVSAKPFKNDLPDLDFNMASDEARPGKAKAHRSIQENFKEPTKIQHNNAPLSLNNVGLVFVLLSIRITLF